MKRLIFSSVVTAFITTSSLQAFGLFSLDVNKEIDRNNALIKQYEEYISNLKQENKYMAEKKSKHPELFVKKPLFEDLKGKYIYRIKLNGAKADALNFMIKDDMVTIGMNMKQEEKSDYGYFYNSRYFSTSYTIPENVVQEKITHKVEGDYFTVEMPKK